MGIDIFKGLKHIQHLLLGYHKSLIILLIICEYKAYKLKQRLTLIVIHDILLNFLIICFQFVKFWLNRILADVANHL